MRPAGFLLLMLGFGLRLDTTWQGTADGLLVCGAALAIVGLLRDRRRAFVRDDGRG